jgi:amino acid transporter
MTKPALRLRDLVIYGVVLVQPIAPVGIFGISERASRGHATATILLAMVAMLFTAFSYGRLAARYPSAGSAYSYVGAVFHPSAGFLVGWAMFLDYLVIPLISTQYAALALQRLFPSTPVLLWVAVFCGAITVLNLRGVRAMAWANRALLSVMCVVVAAFFWSAVRYLGWTGLWVPEALYNPRTFDPRLVLGATSLAALTYIGFDGVTTLTDEVENPRRTVPLATVLVCLTVGLLSAAEVYLAHLIWPDSAAGNVETTFMDAARRAGGELLFQCFGVVLVLANVGSSLTGQAAAARLVCAMAPGHKLLGRVQSNLVLLGGLAFLGATFIDFETGAALVNFGAFLAFMGVNLAAFHEGDRIAPVAGFLFCAAIWLGLPSTAKIAGGAWLALGFAVLVFRRARPAPR